MGINFRKRISIGKGASLNVGKKSIGISGGVKGARVGINSSGRSHFSFGIPGTGIRFTKYSKKGKGIIALCCSAFAWMLIQIFNLVLLFAYWIMWAIFMMFKWIFICVCKMFKYAYSGIIKLFRRQTQESEERRRFE